MFTRLSSFTYGNYKIANTQDADVNSNIELIITVQKYEKQALLLLLGKALSNDLYSNVELDNGRLNFTVKDQADQKFKDLVNGCSYTKDSETFFWKGLVVEVAKIEDKAVYETLMAPYIFFYNSLNNRTQNLGIGEGRASGKNVINESSANKRVDAWNDFVQWSSLGFSENNVSLLKFLQDNEAIYGKCQALELNTLTYYDI